MTRVTIGTFSIELGSDWTLTTVIAAGPMDNGSTGPPMLKSQRQFHQNLVATMEPVSGDETPERYFERQLEGLRQAGIEREEAAPREKVPLSNGLEGLLTEQTVMGPTGEIARQMQLISIKDQHAYTLIATHLAGEQFEHSRNNFRNMLLSFK